MGFDFAGYFEAWNSFDGRRVASFFADDAAYEDVELKRRMVGHEEIAGFVEEAPANLSTDLRFELHRVVGENEAGYPDRMANVRHTRPRQSQPSCNA